MGKIVKHNLACVDQVECKSSDARQVYEDGTSFCFSCTKFFSKLVTDGGEDEPRKEHKVSRSGESLVEIATLPSRGFAERRIFKEVAEFYGVKVAYNSEGEINTHYYPYEGGLAYKVRRLPKNFEWVGKSIDLFGRDKFAPGGKRIIITEGEIDCMAVAQAGLERYKKIYPVVALSSAVMTKSLLENREWLRTFKEIVICFDEDKAGHEAQAEAIRILGIDKVKLTKLPKKDAGQVLVELGSDALQQLIFDASPYIPSGIITKDALWAALESYNNTPSHPYPACLAGVNSKTRGKRLGEISLFVSGTGSGKSSLMREILHDVRETTDDMVGICALEESPAETARKFSGLVLNKNPAYEELTLEELRPGFDKVFGDDKVLVLDHQGGESDDSLVSKIEYMALRGCKYIVLDHITIAVSENNSGMTGLEAQDKMMSDLLRLVKRLNFWLGLVSHLRKTFGNGKSFEEGKLPNLDDIRGSGSTKQISMDVIAFARDMTSANEDVRNTILMSVLKCRYTGLTGPVNGAKYDFPTGRLNGLDSFGISEDVTEL